ncbi:MAG: hypothetical protein H7839_21290 [Magnetococcus sp. YQC-5]
MKKSILLGAAALAAMALAAPKAADAGETKIGGNYTFRMVNTDNTPDDKAGEKTASFMAQRLQLNMDFKANDKSHAHLVTRVLNNNFVQGADFQEVSTVAGDNWNIRQLWLETEAWGVGIKAGNMPLAMNDGILVDNDTTSYGSFLLSKNFGPATLVGGLVKVAEQNTSITTTATTALPTAGATASADIDLWALSVLGKASNIDYQVTGLYLNQEKNMQSMLGGASAYNWTRNGLGPAVNNTNNSVTDGWLALTLGTQVAGIDLTGTAIYETGMTNVTPQSQLAKSGALGALRIKGKTGFGGWNGYGFYSSKNFTSAYPGGNQAHWSATWDAGGPGAQDLMEVALTGAPGEAVPTAASNNMTTDTSNIWGVGIGAAINAGAWTIKPSLDYARVVDDNLKIPGVTDTAAGIAANVGRATYNRALGGTLGFSTKIQESTTLDLSGTWVKPTARVTGTNASNMHYLQASVKLDF